MTADEDVTLRTEYDQLVARILSGVRAHAKPLMKGPPKNLASIEHGLADLLSQPELSLLEIGVLLELLNEWPEHQAQALRDLAVAASSRSAHAVACRSWALAAERQYDLGHYDAFVACAAALRADAHTPAWESFAERLLQASPLPTATDERDLAAASWPGPELAGFVEALSDFKVFPSGSVLCQSGAPATDLYILRTGRVAVAHATARGDRTLRYRGPGDVVGEMGLFAPRGYRTATVTADGPVQAWRVTYSALHAHAEHEALLLPLMQRYVARRLESRVAQHPLLASLDLADRSALRQASSPEPGWVTAGTVLASRGTPMSHVLFLLDGALDLEVTADDVVLGIARHQTTASTGELFGLEALLGSASWRVNIRAAERCCVATIPVDALQACLGEKVMAQLPAWLLGANSMPDV